MGPNDPGISGSGDMDQILEPAELQEDAAVLLSQTDATPSRSGHIACVTKCREKRSPPNRNSAIGVSSLANAMRPHQTVDIGDFNSA
jgi:hypothetical protein